MLNCKRFTGEQILTIAKLLRNIENKDFNRNNVAKEFLNLFDNTTAIYDRNRFQRIIETGDIFYG